MVFSWNTFRVVLQIALRVLKSAFAGNSVFIVIFKIIIVRALFLGMGLKLCTDDVRILLFRVTTPLTVVVCKHQANGWSFNSVGSLMSVCGPKLSSMHNYEFDNVFR